MKEYQVKINTETFENYIEVKKTYNVLKELAICNSPQIVYKLMRDYVKLVELAEEEIYVIAMNTKSRVLGLFMVSHGTVNATVSSPREIFHRALLIGAVNIILVHNHPSLDTIPSADDEMVTIKIKEAGNLLGIKLLDHIIVGNGYYSFREHNKL